MASVFEERVREAREIEGHIASGRDILVPPTKFGAVARLLWGDKTAAKLAVIAGKDERTAKRWLSSEYDPPMSVVVEMLHEIFRRG